MSVQVVETVVGVFADAFAEISNACVDDNRVLVEEEVEVQAVSQYKRFVQSELAGPLMTTVWV